jgi:hypothetical protein
MRSRLMCLAGTCSEEGSGVNSILKYSEALIFKIYGLVLGVLDLIEKCIGVLCFLGGVLFGPLRSQQPLVLRPI